MSNRSRGEGLAVGAERVHERRLVFGRGEGRLERIAREEDALVRGEAAFSRGRVVARLDVAPVRRPIFIGVPEEIRRMCKWSSAFGRPATNRRIVSSLRLIAAAWSSVR